MFPFKSLLVLLFGAVFQDASELGVVEETAHANRSLSVHFVHVFVGKAVTHRG